MGASAYGEASSSRWRGLQSRRGVTAGTVAASLLLTVALLSRRHAPAWVASRPHQTPTAGADVQADLYAAGVVAEEASVAGSAAEGRIAAREALQQRADGAGDDSDSSGSNTSGGGGGGGGSGASKSDALQSTHLRSSKASSAVGEAVNHEGMLTPGGDAAGPADPHQPPAVSDSGSKGSPGDAADGTGAESSASEDVDPAKIASASGDNAAGGADQAGSGADGGETRGSETGSKGDQGETETADEDHSADAAPARRTDKSSSSNSSSSKSQGEQQQPRGNGGGGSDGAHAAENKNEAHEAASEEADAEPSGGAAAAADSSDGGTETSSEHPVQLDQSSKQRRLPAAKSRERRTQLKRQSRGPIQPELLAAVEAAANEDGAVMLAVSASTVLRPDS